MIKRGLTIPVLALLGVIGLMAGTIWGGHRSAVDWGRLRAVCMASDDWGFAGFLPDSSAIEHQDRALLGPRGVMNVYWHSTLEDSAMTADLGAVLARHEGRDGLPALMQPNYILASLAYHPETADSPAAWVELELPDAPPGYERPGLWNVKRELQMAGLWHPELHGRWHYDPGIRRQNTRLCRDVQQAAARQILPFPGATAAWELGPWRDLAVVAAELDRNLEQFENLFGYRPRSVIAPDYRWHDVHENLWLERGLRVIQGQRQQQRESWTGTAGRLRKLLHRTWTRWSRPDRNYLDRNCLFEPVQQPGNHDAAEAALGAILEAWRRGEPAILQTHRINYVHLDRANRIRGLQSLDRLLGGLDALDPVYLVDAEVADLNRRGTSWVARGGWVVLRNATRSRRLVVVPPQAMAAASTMGDRIDLPSGPAVLALEPGEIRILGLADFLEP